MTVHQHKKVIGLAAALVAVGGLAVLAAGLSLPLGVETNPPAMHIAGAGAAAAPAGAPTPNGAEGSTPALAELQRLCAMDLRRPLHDSARPLSRGRSGPKVAPKPTMSVRLIGTVNEPGHSMAMFQKRDGSIALCAEGQSVDDAAAKVTVIRIEHQKVTVRHNGRSRELLVAPRPTAGGRR
jgi:hypothetical protein